MNQLPEMPRFTDCKKHSFIYSATGDRRNCVTCGRAWAIAYADGYEEWIEVSSIRDVAEKAVGKVIE